VVSPLQCYGCGLCRNVCPTEALSMAERAGQ
jgi:Pyruvate/2-oxoacid:ferredoxin oxidoreductase delta subunit